MSRIALLIASLFLTTGASHQATIQVEGAFEMFNPVEHCPDFPQAPACEKFFDKLREAIETKLAVTFNLVGGIAEYIIYPDGVVEISY